jgi:hypothetical protein
VLPPGGGIAPALNPGTPLAFVADLFSAKTESVAFSGIVAALRAADPGAGGFMPREITLRTTFTTTKAPPTTASMASAAIVLALALRAETVLAGPAPSGLAPAPADRAAASIDAAAVPRYAGLRADVGRWVALLDEDARAGILEWRYVRPGNRPAARAAALASAQAAMVAALARNAQEDAAGDAE